MKIVSQRTDLEVLRDRWGRWTAILSQFARNRPSHRRIDPSAYASLRNELINACRSLAETDASGSNFYTGLEEMVDPWLNLGVLDRTDHETLFALLRHCREVELRLNGRKSKRALPIRWERAMAIVVRGAIVGGLVWLFFMAAGVSVLDTLNGVFNTIWWQIVFADTLQRSTVLAVMLIVVSMYLVTRISKS
jgi:hypothetical protein